MRAQSGGLRGCWTGRDGRTGGGGAVCPGRGCGSPRGGGAGLAEWGAPAWFCTWREGPSGTGTLVESHFCQSLICKPVGVSFPAGSFSYWGRDEGGEDTQSPGRALGLRCSKGLRGRPPDPHPRSQTWGTMLVALDRAAEHRRVARASLLGSLAPRKPPEAGLPPSDRRGSLTRTVLRKMVNKEQLFAAFDEWDSASYRPHSESSIRYSLRTRWCWASGPSVGCIPLPGPWGRALVPPPPRSLCRSRCRWSRADGCSTGTNVC